jgi:diadenylate cyclase
LRPCSEGRETEDMWLWISTIIQISVLACMFYYIFLFFRGTRGAQVLVGLGFLLAILIGLTQIFNFDALNWILRNLSVFLGAAILIIFQPEIRRALAELGKQPVFSVTGERRTVIDHVVESVVHLAEHRVGALIAIEREIGTRSVQETGIKIDAPVVPELLSSIFYPHTPLHDGGVIIAGNRLLAAGCVFPLSHDAELHKTYGTRHRAAVGLSEETDAVVIVVSEETGAISTCYHGQLNGGMDGEQLKVFLSDLLLKQSSAVWHRAQQELDLTPDGIAKSDKQEQGSKAHNE